VPETPNPARWSRLVTAACAAAPGLLLGTQIGGLLFFLNPDLPFSAASVTRALLTYAPRGAAGSLVLILPWTWNRPARARRLLPWSLAVVLAMAAGLAAGHASHFAYYLPAGINRRLLKAALWFALGALACFYTALLHTLHRRSYGWRSRLGLTLVVLASVYAMIERREAFRSSPPISARPAGIEAHGHPRLLVVGLDTATLDAVLPLAEQGQLPVLHRLLRSGASVRLAAPRPSRRLPLWTTLATGKYPYEHGLVSGWIYAASPFGPTPALKLLPEGVAFRSWGTSAGPPQRLDGSARRAQPLWRILARQGLAVRVVSWPGSYPADPLLRYCFSDRFFEGVGGGPPAVVPESLGDPARRLRAEVGEIPNELRARLGGRVPPAVLRAVAHDLWRERVAVNFGQPGELDADFVFLGGLFDVSRELYGGFAAAQFEGSNARDAQDAAQLLSTYYSFLDGLLGELVARAQGAGPTLVAVVSAYGAESPGPWNSAWRHLAGENLVAGEVENGADGLLVVAAAGVRSGPVRGAARIVDVVPTLLYASGFPVANDMEGRVLTEMFEADFLAGQPLTFLTSYETPEPPR